MLSKGWLLAHAMIGTGDLVPRACHVVRPRLLGTTGQCRIATNEVWVGYQ
jgi:hypothetical protein